MEAYCPRCNTGLRELGEDQWPAEGPVPPGTLAVFQCEQDHRITVGETQVQA
ncbi:hypothetical protein [Arthrobacter sp. RIT-PI-e]|uniref:hypothetical protein n=1 Tax=Arthrobacter sp. RIT-PI-e TaxID=1681197 RepID=UPI001364D0C4|nr:hypothetical protein [Arthrobacter sp. RIT-PI-e]